MITRGVPIFKLRFCLLGISFIHNREESIIIIVIIIIIEDRLGYNIIHVTSH